MQQNANRRFFQYESYIYLTGFTELDKYDECWKKSSFATSYNYNYYEKRIINGWKAILFDTRALTRAEKFDFSTCWTIDNTISIH